MLRTAIPLCALLVGSGCAMGPPVEKNGLPRVSRYTNVTQVDWMLDRYAKLAGEAAGRGDAALAQRACLGWERTVFDMQSFRRYPVILRLSMEGANLNELRDDFWQVVNRHPLPAVCGQGGTEAGGEAAKERRLLVQLRQAIGLPIPGVRCDANDAGCAAGQGGVGQVPAAPTAEAAAAPAGDAAPAEGGEVAAAAAPTTASPVGEDRPVGCAMGDDPDCARGHVRFNQRIDAAALAPLAQSEVWPIRVRARFHQLGQCVVAVEDHDRFPSAPKQCDGARKGEPPRHTQVRLREELLRTLMHGPRGPEPLADVAMSLLTFASRDNPMYVDTLRSSLR